MKTYIIEPDFTGKFIVVTAENKDKALELVNKKISLTAMQKEIIIDMITELEDNEVYYMDLDECECEE